MRRRPYSASHISTAKQCIPKLSAISNTRALLLQKCQDSFACIVWSCNGKAVNLKNPPVFATLVKITSQATESGGVLIRKFSVRVSSWMLARDSRPLQNCNLGLAVSPRPQVCSVGFSTGRPLYMWVFPPQHYVARVFWILIYFSKFISDRWISDTAAPVCVLIVLEVLVAVVQSI